MSLTAALAVFVASGEAARHGSAGHLEQRCFHAVNDLPDDLYRPAWTLMQLGSLGGVMVTAGAATATGRAPLGARLLTCGTATWVTARAIKPLFRRGRPAAVLGRWRVLGREQSGLGFPSGHAAVAASLAAVLTREASPSWRPTIWVAAATVGVARLYVGAHLPLDVIGGAALGVAVAGAVPPRRGEQRRRDVWPYWPRVPGHTLTPTTCRRLM